MQKSLAFDNFFKKSLQIFEIFLIKARYFEKCEMEMKWNLNVENEKVESRNICAAISATHASHKELFSKFSDSYHVFYLKFFWMYLVGCFKNNYKK